MSTNNSRETGSGRRAWKLLAALGVAALLGGCVAYPAYPDYGYGYGYGPGYSYGYGGYPAGGYVAFGDGWGGHGDHRGWDHDHDRGWRH